MRKLIIAVAALALPVAAFAEENVENLLTPWGMSVSVGGAVGGFVTEDMRDMTGTSGGWNARFAIGTRKIVGFEGAYVGGFQSIDSFLLDSDARLLSTSLEANVRVNVLRASTIDSPVQPFAFAGLAYRRYDLTNADINLSSVESEDTLVEVPIGIGASYTVGRFLFDLRGAYRPAWDADLVPDAKQGTGLATWSLNLQAGYEF